MLKLATLAYVRDGDRTLMLRRPGGRGGHKAGRCNGLGGKFERGESPEQCLAREVLEESGLVVEEARLKGFITFPDFLASEDWYVWVYVVTKYSGDVTPSPEGELFWHPTARLTDLHLWDGDAVFLPWLDLPGTFSARFVYEDGAYKSHEVAFYP